MIRSIKRWLLTVLVALLAMAACQWVGPQQQSPVLGLVAPSQVLFPDVSKYQPVADWAALDASGTPVLALRVYGPSDGGKLDPTLAGHLAGAERLGLWQIGYLFGHGSVSPSVLVQKLLDGFPLNRHRLAVLDLETTPAAYGPSMTTDQAQAVVNLYAARTGYALGLYSSEGQSRPGILGRMWRWIARYRDTRPAVPTGSGIGQMVAWQRSDGTSGPLPHAFAGIGTPCDINQLFGSLSRLRRLWPGRFLRLGVRGADVGRAQRRLGITPTNLFDSATRAAVLTFQRSTGLPADGVIGNGTWARLFG